MTLEELGKRVRALEDLEQIKTLHREYLMFIQNLEMDKALDCFSENIVTDIAQYGIKKGKKEVSKFFKEVIRENVFVSRDGHFTVQPVIKLDGDKAKANWMFYRLVPQGERRFVQGRYDCEYVRENGKWKFSLVKLTRPWPAFFK
jgi:hypothetical protein